MARILNFFRVIRNNWKKSIVGTAALSYGVSYSKEVYDTDQLMREYCESVEKYGDAPLPTYIKPRHVTVILNPSANKGKAKKLFKKYCEPLLHLSGIAVTIIQTEPDNAARKIVMNLDKPTDAIIVAGGDGTVSDVVTGLARKYDSISSVKQCPIGILPLGKTNRVAKSLYHEYDDLSNVRELIEATLAVINERSTMRDIIEIEPIDEDPAEPVKRIYSLGTLEWGAWKDAHSSTNKYWYWGPLRKYATYVFNGYKQSLNWNCNAVVKYTEPCSGCSRCYQNDSLAGSAHTNTRWWHVFVPRPKNYSTNFVDYSKITNENCSVYHELPVSTTELHIETSNINKQENLTEPSSLKLRIGPKDVSYVSFVSEGWRQEHDGKLLKNEPLEAKTIELIPQEVQGEKTFYIDNEEYELKAIRIKLHSQAVKIFCPEPGI